MLPTSSLNAVVRVLELLPLGDEAALPLLPLHAAARRAIPDRRVTANDQLRFRTPHLPRPSISKNK
jgi:hypothetical protein